MNKWGKDFLRLTICASNPMPLLRQKVQKRPMRNRNDMRIIIITLSRRHRNLPQRKPRIPCPGRQLVQRGLKVAPLGLVVPPFAHPAEINFLAEFLFELGDAGARVGGRVGDFLEGVEGDDGQQ